MGRKVLVVGGALYGVSRVRYYARGTVYSVLSTGYYTFLASPRPSALPICATGAKEVVCLYLYIRGTALPEAVRLRPASRRNAGPRSGPRAAGCRRPPIGMVSRIYPNNTLSLPIYTWEQAMGGSRMRRGAHDRGASWLQPRTCAKGNFPLRGQRNPEKTRPLAARAARPEEGKLTPGQWNAKGLSR